MLARDQYVALWPIQNKVYSAIVHFVCFVYKMLLFDTDLENPFLKYCLRIISMLSVLTFLRLDDETCLFTD